MLMNLIINIKEILLGDVSNDFYLCFEFLNWTLILFPLNVIISESTYSKTLETAFSTECIYVLILSSISKVATSA